MTILFDLSASQPIYTNDFHGGSEYCKKVFTKLCEKTSNNLTIDVFFNQNKYLDPTIRTLCDKLKITTFNHKNNRDINWLLNEKHYDLFYSALPYSYIDIIIPPQTVFVYTIHGLRALEYPWDPFILKYKKPDRKTIIKYIFHLFLPGLFIHLFIKRNLNNFSKLFSLAKNQNIIAISDHSKYSLLYFFAKDLDSKIMTLYSPPKPIDPIKNNETDTLALYKVKPKKYILMICGDRSEKGAYRACRAIVKLLIKKNQMIPNDLKVVILGVTYLKYYKTMTHNSDSFVFLDYVSPEHLEIFYKNAHLFLYPTMNEGFGYPPLEAMKYSTLCACSANSAVMEICSDAVLYFNPFSETEIGIRILQSFDNNIYNEKKKKMDIQYKKIYKRQEEDLEKLIDLLINPAFS
jgi:glycosyltransferase involved in cell wall biosynthesis